MDQPRDIRNRAPNRVLFFVGGNMLMKICPRCGKHITAGSSCSCKTKRVKEERRRYDKKRRDPRRRELYHSRMWEQVRQTVKARAHGLDEVMWSQGKIEPGTTAHHIIPVEDRPDLKFDLLNLVWISAHTHKNIHREYRKSRSAKEAAQRRLRAIVDKRWTSHHEGDVKKV